MPSMNTASVHCPHFRRETSPSGITSVTYHLVNDRFHWCLGHDPHPSSSVLAQFWHSRAESPIFIGRQVPDPLLETQGDGK